MSVVYQCIGGWPLIIPRLSVTTVNFSQSCLRPNLLGCCSELCVVICSQILSLSTDFKSVNSSKSTKNQEQESDKDQFCDSSLLTLVSLLSVRHELPGHLAQHLGVGVQHVAHLLRGAALRVPSPSPEAASLRPPSDLRGRGQITRRPRCRPARGHSRCGSPQPRASVSRPRPLQPGRAQCWLSSIGRRHDGPRGGHAWSSLPLLL